MLDFAVVVPFNSDKLADFSLTEIPSTEHPALLLLPSSSAWERSGQDGVQQAFTSNVPYQVEGLALLILNSLPPWVHFPPWHKDGKSWGTLCFVCDDLPACVKCQEPALLILQLPVCGWMLFPKFGDQVALVTAQLPTSFLGVCIRKGSVQPCVRLQSGQPGQMLSASPCPIFKSSS